MRGESGVNRLLLLSGTDFLETVRLVAETKMYDSALVKDAIAKKPKVGAKAGSCLNLCA